MIETRCGLSGLPALGAENPVAVGARSCAMGFE